MTERTRLTFLSTCLLICSFWLSASAQNSPYADLIKEVDGAGIYQGADLAVVFDSTDVLVEATGLSHVVNHKLIKILTWDGARRMTGLRFDFDPASNLMEPRKVVVHRADGSVQNVELTGLQDLFAPQSMIYWGVRMKVLELPRLNVGDAVELESYKKGFQIAYLHEQPAASQDEERYIPPMRGHYYDVISFQENDPLREKVYTIRLLRSMPAQYRVYNGEVFSALTFDGDRFVYTFWKTNVPAMKHEPRQPSSTDFIPKVVLATVKDWQEKSRWFFLVNDTVFAADDAVRETAKQIVKGLRDDDERIAAVLHWTAQNIRYSGISMGKGEGYTLHPGTMTLHDRCGVCKDIAGMSITLLRALDYTVYPAMTMAGARVEMIPADQFNHCVVAVKRQDGSYTMIDPTWTPYAMDIWSPAEAEQHYVIGSPEGEDRMAIRTYAAQENQTRFKLTGKINDNGDLEGVITLTGTSYGDTRLRRGVAYTPAERHRAMFTDWLAYLAPQAELLEAKLSKLDDLDKPLTIELRFVVPQYALKAGEQMLLKSPLANFVQANPRAFNLVHDLTAEERETPLLLWCTRQIVLEESLNLPSGYSLIGEAIADSVGGQVAFCTTNLQCQSGAFKSALEYRIEQRTVDAKDYQQLKESYDALKEFAKTTRQLKKGS